MFCFVKKLIKVLFDHHHHHDHHHDHHHKPHLPIPNSVTFKLIGTTYMTLIETVTIPAYADSRAVSLEWTLDLDGTSSTSSHPVTGDVLEGVEIEDGATVTSTLVAVTASGQRSDPKVQSFVAVNTLPLAVPGDVSFVVTGTK